MIVGFWHSVWRCFQIPNKLVMFHLLVIYQTSVLDIPKKIIVFFIHYIINPPNMKITNAKDINEV